MKKAVIMVLLCMFLFSLASFVYAEQERNQEMNEVSNGISEIKDDLQELKEQRHMLNKDIRNLSVSIKELMKDKKEIWLNISGKNLTIRELTEEQKEMIAEKINAKTGLNLTADDIDNRTVLRAYLSNGRKAIIKIMPDTASENAIAILKLKFCNEKNNCTIELKEVGQGNQTGNQTRAVYEVKATKEKRVWLFWKKKVQVQTEVEAE